MFVGPVVVHDHMELQVGRELLLQVLEELQGTSENLLLCDLMLMEKPVCGLI